MKASNSEQAMSLLMDWVTECHYNGLKVLGRFVRESCYWWNPNGYEEELDPDRAADMWIASVPWDAIQVGNEPDVASPASWTMPAGRLSKYLLYFRRRWHGKLVCAGTASGNPAYLKDVDLSLCDAVAIHPYTQTPKSIKTLLPLYAPYLAGKELWFTEYDDVSMTEVLAGLATVSFKFSWQDWNDGHGNVWEGGLVDTEGNEKTDYRIFTKAVARINQPAPREKESTLPEFVWGFKAYAEAHDVGEPVEDEWTERTAPGFISDVVRCQHTTKGILRWYSESNKITFQSFSGGE
jgi:hypothetical protein